MRDLDMWDEPFYIPPAPRKRSASEVARETIRQETGYYENCREERRLFEIERDEMLADALSDFYEGEKEEEEK